MTKINEVKKAGNWVSTQVQTKWIEYEGKTILVRGPKSRPWVPRVLYKYDEVLEDGFICREDNGVTSWRYGKVPEVDWSKVPVNTEVQAYNCRGEEKGEVKRFLGYHPDAEFPYWVFLGTDTITASGYQYCELVEPCKEEWVQDT